MNVWTLLWPVLITVLSNVFYNICTKSAPSSINAFATLMITYLVAAGVTAVLFLATAKFQNVGTELHKLNWTSFVLGVAIVGLEVGYIFLYRAGWKVSQGSVVCNIVLAIALIFVGVFAYKEHISIKQVIGMVMCSGGLWLMMK